MNNKYSKAGIALPVIQELRKSSESTSTLESDSWAMEYLEMNLFDNLRDSIQRSLGSSHLTTTMVHYDKIKEQKKPDASNAKTLKKIDDSSEIKLKPTTALRKHDVTRQCKGHTSKPSHGNAESNLIRPPKVSSETILLPASVPGKKASTEIKEIKGATAKQQSIVAFTKANAVPGILPRTTLSRKPNSGSQTATLGSSSNSLTTSSSDSKSVSSVATVEKINADRTNNYSSSRTGKTPLNISITGSTVESHHRNLSKSILVLSKISPVSSIDSVVSESSSSTSTKLGNSLEGSDAGSSSSSVAISSSLGVSHRSASLSQSFIEDRTKRYINGDCGSRLVRPSGLRAPRPTIGYFDKEKTLVRGSNKVPNASLQNNLMKNANVNYTSATNKLKSIDLPTVRNRGLPSTLSKLASKSAKVNFVTKVENNQKLCPKVNKIFSETVEQNCKINFKDKRVPTDEVEKVQSCNASKKEEPNLLHPNVFARENETETIGEQDTHYQPYRMHNQENVKIDRSDRETEKENVCPDLKIEDPSKMQNMEVVVGGEDVLSVTF